jgi:uncharacterized protein
MMTHTEATVATASATSYLRQLCRHWAHKFPVTFDDQQGRIELPKGVCTLQATPEALHVALAVPDPADTARLQEVVAEHLQRFGFRETLVFAWHEQAHAGAN